MNARVQEFIVAGPIYAGAGVTGDPRRTVTQIFTRDGQLFATIDPVGDALAQQLRTQVANLAGRSAGCETVNELRREIGTVAALVGMQV